MLNRLLVRVPIPPLSPLAPLCKGGKEGGMGGRGGCRGRTAIQQSNRAVGEETSAFLVLNWVDCKIWILFCVT
ncbi:MAG: hypothetical protein AB4290_19075, partial [Spirulina sp.]